MITSIRKQPGPDELILGDKPRHNICRCPYSEICAEMGWFRAALNKEPAMMISALLAVGAVSIPFIVVPIRRSLGKPTYQWDSDVDNHPVCALTIPC